MARPSKLSPDQWKEVGARLLAGESGASLAREFGVPRSSISERFSERNRTVRDAAEKLVAAETAVLTLPPQEQQAARTLAESLMSISFHAAGAAENGMAIAHRLSGIGRLLVEQVDDANPLESMAQLKAVHAMGKIANDAAQIGLNLLAANKGIIPTDPPKTVGALPVDVLEAAEVYRRLMG
jgi:hypothetical protein